MNQMGVDDLRAVIREDPCDFIYQRQAITGVRGAVINQDRLSDEGGFVADLQFSITYVMEDLPHLPEVGEHLDVDNVPYRIMRVAIDEFKSGVQLDVQTAYQ